MAVAALGALSCVSPALAQPLALPSRPAPTPASPLVVTGWRGSNALASPERALPKPAEVSGDDPVPGPDYETVRVGNHPVAVFGWSFFAGSYLLGALAPTGYLYEEVATGDPMQSCRLGQSTGCSRYFDQFAPLFVPLIGPWLTMATTVEAENFIAPTGILLGMAGLAQASGLVIGLVGLGTKREVHRFVGRVEPRVGLGSLTLVARF